MSEALRPSARPMVLADLLPRRRAVDIALVIGVAALTGVAAQFRWYPNDSGVPFTFSTLVVLAGGAVLGAERAFAGFLLYAIAGGVGVPWFAGHQHGFGIPTFGYILGYLLAATVIGAVARRGGVRTPLRTLLAMAAGTAIIYALGASWYAHEAGWSAAQAWDKGVQPFLVFDLVKAAAAVALLPAASRLLPRH